MFRPAESRRSTALTLAVAAALVAGCATVPAGDPATAKAAEPSTATAAAAAGAAGAAAARSAATTPAPSAPGATPPNPAAAAAGAAAAAAAAAAAQGRPFAEVVKDAKETKGLYTLYQKDDKIWMEIGPEQFDKPFFFTVNLSTGIGENFLFAGLMGGYSIGQSQVAVLRKVGTNVQLIARNERYFAKAGSREATAVEEAFSDSLLAVTPVASKPHPERNSVLIELSALLMNDIPGGNGALERVYRQPYSFDARNSAITKTRVTPEQVSANVNAHYALARVMQPPVTPSPSYVPPPTTLPDVRSLFLGFYYNFAKLPDTVMRPRLADARIGYFTTARYDYSNDGPLTPRQTYVRRWRLEKADPAAELSEPKKPIVFWIDRNIPTEYRATIAAGVEEWNKAYERIGFKNAVQARIQPDDADFETLDARHASIRWMPSARPLFGGIGPSQVDPRSGEILDADILIDPTRIRNRRAQYTDQVVKTALAYAAVNPYLCVRAELAEQEVGFALDLLEARGDIAPGSAEEQKFVLDDLKEVIMHEVGHALGFTHNFRASTIYTRAQLNDLEFTEKNGLGGSVMEYNPVNLATKGEAQGSYSMKTLGPYDYWVVEYGYRELPAESENAELKKIAARSAEPQLAYAYDTESSIGIDPDANISDLSNDPLDFARRRIALSRELWDRWQTRPLPVGDSLSLYRRNITRGLNSLREAGMSAARYIGGVSILRDAAGSGRTPLNPVPPARQRDALKLIEVSVFSAGSFRFRADFMRKLSIDWLDMQDTYDVGLSTPGYDYSLPNQVLTAQRAVLDRVMSDAVAQRLLDSEAKVDNPREALKLSEVYGSLHTAIWSELKTGEDIPLLRRNLQREHLTRLSAALLRPVATMPADARAVARADARALRAEIAAGQNRKGLSAEARAHLAESLQSLDEALKAPVIRTTL